MKRAPVGVVGLGAIGGAVAARLLASRREGERFGLAAGSAESAARIGAQGFVVLDGGAEQRASLRREAGGPDAIAAALPRFDDSPYALILLCTRAEATPAALDAALPLLAPDGAIACLQNGLPEARVAERAGVGRTLGAVIGWSATSKAPGEIAITGRGGFLLGALDPQDARARAWLGPAALLLGRAFPARLTDNLAGARWGKLALNCAISTLGAISGLSFGELASRRDARALALACIAEVAAVARAKGVRLARISGLDPRWLADAGGAGPVAQLARPLRHGLFWIASRQRPAQRSGMLERLLAGRTSGQIDDLNGAVLAEARARGVPAPLNARLVELVHAIERGEARIGVHNLAALAERVDA